jgi:hypothetical protein
MKYKFIMLTVKGKALLKLILMTYDGDMYTNMSLTEIERSYYDAVVSDQMLQSPENIQNFTERPKTNYTKFNLLIGYFVERDIQPGQPYAWLKVRQYLKRRLQFTEEDMDFDWLVQHGYFNFF